LTAVDPTAVDPNQFSTPIVRRKPQLRTPYRHEFNKRVALVPPVRPAYSFTTRRKPREHTLVPDPGNGRQGYVSDDDTL